MANRTASSTLCLLALLLAAAPVRGEQGADVIELPTSLALHLADVPETPAAGAKQDTPPVVSNDPYVGGRGLITVAGPSGMFINPTSGTLQQGQFTLQWCFLNQDDVVNTDGSHFNGDVIGNGLMAAYGITDWLEIGAFGLWASYTNFQADGSSETLFVGGPFFRVRILKDDANSWLPEVSVGGLWYDGDKTSDSLSKQEVFAAASKYISINEDACIRGVRFHVGVRQIWNKERLEGAKAQGAVGYFGFEVELPYDLWVVSEVTQKNDIIGGRTPFAVGMHWRPNNVLGLSIAGMNAGDADRIAFWFGIGLNFKF